MMKIVKEIIFFCIVFMISLSCFQNSTKADSEDYLWKTATYNGVEWHYAILYGAGGACRVYTESEYSGELPYVLDGCYIYSYGNSHFSGGKIVGNPVVAPSTKGKVIVPEGITEIPTLTFYGCYNLTEIVLPETCQKIWSRAFEGCTSLQSINLPDRIGLIEQDAFRGCSSLEEIKLPDNLNEVKFGCFYGCTGLKKVVMPEVRYICDLAFWGCENLRDVTLPEGLKEIGTAAFCWAGMEEVVIPNSVEKIGLNAFPDEAFVYTPYDSPAYQYLEKNPNDFNPKLAYQLCFDANYGQKSTLIPKLYYNGTRKVCEKLFTREGCYLAFWAENPDGTGRTFALGEEVIPWNTTSYINTLYAIWKKEGTDEIVHDKEDNTPSTDTEDNNGGQGENTPPTGSEDNTGEPGENTPPTDSEDNNGGQGGEQAQIPLLENFYTERIYSYGKNGFQARVQISWKKNDTVSKVCIYRSSTKQGNYVLIGTVSGNKNSYIDKKVKKGGSYYYRILGEDANGLKGQYTSVSNCKISKKIVTPILTYQKKGKKLIIHFKRAEGSAYESQWREGIKGKWLNMRSVRGKIKRKITKKILIKTTFQIRFRTTMKVGKKKAKSAWSDSYTVRMN